MSRIHWIVYYETIKRESKIKPNSECRWDERLKTFKVVYYESRKREVQIKTKSEESTGLSDTGLLFIMNRENES